MNLTYGTHTPRVSPARRNEMFIIIAILNNLIENIAAYCLCIIIFITKYLKTSCKLNLTDQKYQIFAPNTVLFIT